MVSKDHLINSEHKETNHICLAYEIAEKGIEPLLKLERNFSGLVLRAAICFNLRAIDLSKLQARTLVL